MIFYGWIAILLKLCGIIDLNYKIDFLFILIPLTITLSIILTKDVELLNIPFYSNISSMDRVSINQTQEFRYINNSFKVLKIMILKNGNVLQNIRKRIIPEFQSMDYSIIHKLINLCHSMIGIKIKSFIQCFIQELLNLLL